MGRLVLVTLTLVAAASGRLALAADPQFVVVVHRANPVSSISRAELSAIFMKRMRSWPDRSPIVPVDQPAASRVRESFSRSIHGKSVAYVTRYWHRVIFAGRGIPPLEVSNDAAVLDLIRLNRGAIGYVAADAVRDDVKVVAVTR